MRRQISNRPNLHKIYADSTELWASRGTCARVKVGGILVREGRIVASGFNGSPSGEVHCVDKGCLIQVRDGRDSCLRALHCEQAIISFCAKHAVSTNNCDLWITLAPCYDCAKVLVNAGIKKVFYRDAYTGASGLKLLKHAGIEALPWAKLGL